MENCGKILKKTYKYFEVIQGKFQGNFKEFK